jgi:hypothetical protein
MSSQQQRIKHRAFNAHRRIATAVQIKSGQTFQVWPSKALFETVDEWKSAWPAADRFETYIGRVAPHNDYGLNDAVLRLPLLARRREKEFAEFVDPDYKWLIRCVNRSNDETLEVELNDGGKVTVTRSTNYLRPPTITYNGIHLPISACAYTPALTAIRYLLMLLFVKSE